MYLIDLTFHWVLGKFCLYVHKYLEEIHISNIFLNSDLHLDNKSTLL